MRDSSLFTAADLWPHDLLWVGAAGDVTPVDRLPAWATTDWVAVAPVVVRRAPRSGDRVPVGLRGATRQERCAAQVDADRIVRKVTPQDIARGVRGDPRIGRSALPCLRSLARLAAVLDDLSLSDASLSDSALRWGVTGSVGFTLASGFDVLRPDSDLDLLVRLPRPGDADALRALGLAMRGAESRVDVQVDTGHGGFALAEWLRTGGPVLLKTAQGPVLCEDPWSVPGLEATLPGRPVVA